MVTGDQTRDSRKGLLDMAWPRCFDGYVEDSEMGGKRPKQNKTFDAGGGQCGYVSVFIMYFFLLGLARCPYCLVAPKRRGI